jgi:hypothetical protein
MRSPLTLPSQGVLTMPNVYAAAFAGIVLLGFSLPAGAAVIQEASVSFTPTVGAPVTATDSINVPTSGEIDRPLLATIGAPFSYTATVSVGTFGTYGMQATQRIGGRLETRVLIRSDEFVNTTGRPARARSSFIIDGGTLLLSAAPGATIQYDLTITNLNGTSFPGAPFPQDEAFFIPFETSGTLTSTGFNSTIFTSGGVDIGAVPTGPIGVQIPLSLQEVDLGLIQPGEVLDLQYQMIIFSDVGALEGASWAFSDPLSVLPPDAAFFPLEVTFETVSQTVPEPATLPMLLAGIGGLLWLARRPPRGKPRNEADVKWVKMTRTTSSASTRTSLRRMRLAHHGFREAQ